MISQPFLPKLNIEPWLFSGNRRAGWSLLQWLQNTKVIKPRAGLTQYFPCCSNLHFFEEIIITRMHLDRAENSACSSAWWNLILQECSTHFLPNTDQPNHDEIALEATRCNRTRSHANNKLMLNTKKRHEVFKCRPLLSFLTCILYAFENSSARIWHCKKIRLHEGGWCGQCLEYLCVNYNVMVPAASKKEGR